MYIKVTAEGDTVWPYSLNRLRPDHPNVSFPKSLTEELLAAYGIYKVSQPVDPVTFDPHLQEAVQQTPQLIDGVYRRVVTLVDLPDDAVATRMRDKRDTLLIDTDFHAMSDRTMSDEMRTYRQALRDVPTQAGFPKNVTWPERP